MYVGRNGRPSIPAIREHNYRVVNPDLCVEKFSVVVRKAAQFGSAEDVLEEIDGVVRAIDDEIGRDSTVFVGFVRCAHRPSVWHFFSVARSW
jgi:hypothetical protein